MAGSYPKPIVPGTGTSPVLTPISTSSIKPPEPPTPPQLDDIQPEGPPQLPKPPTPPEPPKIQAPPPGLMGPPAPPGPGYQLPSWLNPAAAGGALSNLFQQGQNAAVNYYTQAYPPLSRYVPEPLARFFQRLSADPTQFAMWASTLGAPLTRGILGMPMGLPLLMGGQALLAGGQPFADLYTLVNAMGTAKPPAAG